MAKGKCWAPRRAPQTQGGLQVFQVFPPPGAHGETRAAEEPLLWRWLGEEQQPLPNLPGPLLSLSFGLDTFLCRKKGTELQPGRLLTPGARGEEWHPPPKLNSVSTPVISKKQKLSSSRRRAIQTHLEVPGGNPSSLGEENKRKLKALPLGKGRNACCLTFHDAWRKATSPTLMVTVPAKTRRKQNASDPLPDSPATSLTSTK